MNIILFLCFQHKPYIFLYKLQCIHSPRCAMVFGGVVSRDGLGLGRIGAPGYRAHRSVAMAPMFKGISLVGIIFASKFEKW